MSTKLDIINAMLLASGETPVQSEDSLHPSALQAQAWFERASKEFQSRGYWFNTEYNLVLTPNLDGEIVLPTGTLKCVCLTSGGFIRRSGKLYDPYNHTYVIDTDVTLNIILELDPDDLPPVAVNYLTAKCVFDWYVAEGDGGSERKYETDMIKAKAALTDTEIQEAKVSVFKAGLPLQMVSRLTSGTSSGNPTYPGGTA